MMNLACESCRREASVDEQAYSGRRLKLKCPYCQSIFIVRVPSNGGRVPTGVVPDVTIGQTESADPTRAEQVTEVDEALVHEAKRISRLIISEIKLYNQDKIARAKSRREVLDLLKNDLIKGKQHYNTRIASKLPTGPDYFMETVKEILLAGKG